MLRSLPVGCLLAAAAVALAAPPAPAATLSQDPATGELVYVAEGGEANRLTIRATARTTSSPTTPR